MGGATFEEEDIPEEDKTRLEKLAEKPCLLWLTFIAFTIYGIVGVMFDWLWVSDMLNVEQALVFGPPSSATVNSLIVIASVGTVAFGIEISNFVMKVRLGHKLLPEDIAQIISLFAEEVPQITLNYLLASCREVPVSYYALVKAALAMVGAGLRATTMFFHYIQPKKKAKRRGFIPWLIRTAILVACVYNFTGAILVWIFTYQEPADAGVDGGFRPPDSVSKSYDTDRYLYKSGVFFSHPSFAQCNGNSAPWDSDKFNWAQLVEIYDVTDADGEYATATFAYSDEENYMHMKVPEVDRSGIIGYIETCFHVDLKSNCAVEKFDDPAPCIAAVNIFNNTMNFTFYSVPKTKTIVFGDIRVNISLSTPNGCDYLRVDDVGKLELGNQTVAQMKYFRVLQEINDTFIENFLLDNDYRYYMFNGPADDTNDEQKEINKKEILHEDITENDVFKEYHFGNVLQSVNDEHKEKFMEDEGDLLSVFDEWKTGYKRCDMTGSYRPNPVILADGDCEQTDGLY